MFQITNQLYDWYYSLDPPRHQRHQQLSHPLHGEHQRYRSATIPDGTTGARRDPNGWPKLQSGTMIGPAKTHPKHSKIPKVQQDSVGLEGSSNRSLSASCTLLFCNSWTTQTTCWKQLFVPSGNLTYLWKITVFTGTKHYKDYKCYKWPFSIAMLVYQRVCLMYMVALARTWLPINPLPPSLIQSTHCLTPPRPP